MSDRRETPARLAHVGNRRTFGAHDWWVPHRGVRLPAGARAPRDLIDAALAAAPSSAVVSGLSAAVLWDVPIPMRLLSHPVELTMPPGGFHIARPGVRCRRRLLHPDHVTTHQGRRVISTVRLVIDVGEHLAVPDIVAVADDLLRRHLVDRAPLVHWAHRLRRRQGIRAVREALEYMDPRSESPRESAMRYHLWRHGYTDLQPNVDIHDSRGRFIARGDLVDRQRRIVVEYDGDHHLSRAGQSIDASRRLALTAAGWFHVTIVSEDVSRPARLLAKVATAYAALR